MDAAIARERGEDGVIAIQGALILLQGLNDPSPYSASDAAVAPNAVPRFT